MSLSRITYAADGSTQSFGVPFVFRDRVDVFVYVGENILANGIAATFTWQNDSQITVTLPLVTNGVEVQVIRRTKSTALDVTFIDGSGLPAGDLNAAVLQLYYLLQESLDDLGDYADAAASAAAALVSENAAAADLALTNADVVLTNADVVLTNADVVLTNADVVLTNADVVLTNADVVSTNADVVTTGNVVGAVAMPYVFNATTTMADPTTGLFRLNSATPASVTAIAIDDTTNATGNPDISAFLATWDDSSSTIKGTLQIVQEDTPANFMTFNITALTDNAGWVQLTVAHVAGSTLFGSAKACRLQFIRNGDAGVATDLTAPGPIGSVTASTGDFTTLNSTGGALNGTLGATTASTGAFTTLTSSTSLDIGSTIAITGVLDEDNMSSNSAVKLATQQSIKAYVDSSPSGKCLQMVSMIDSAVATGTTLIPMDDTIPQNTEGTEFMSLAITPISATSKLVIMVDAIVAIANGSIEVTSALFVDSTAGALAASSVFPYYSTNQRAEQLSLKHVVASGSTSARTYKFRMGPNTTETITFNGKSSARIYGGVASSSITIMEIE
jgi:hypothetical protein